MRALHVFPSFVSGSPAAEQRYAHHLTKALEDLRIHVATLNSNKPSLPFLAKTWSALARCDVVLLAFAPDSVMSAVSRLARARRKPVVVLPSLTGELPRDPRPLGKILASAAAA